MPFLGHKISLQALSYDVWFYFEIAIYDILL